MKMKQFLLSLLIAGSLAAQCSQQSVVTVAGGGPVIDNRSLGCTYFRLSYYTNASAISISVQGAQGPVGPWTNFATAVSGSNPDTTVPSSSDVVNNYYPYVRVNAGTLTGGQVNWSLIGQNGPNAASASNGGSGGGVTLTAINTAITPCTFGSGILTCTGFATSGIQGGQLSLGQGTLPSLGTNTVSITAPLSVTSYGLLYPGTAPAANQALVWGTPSGGYSTGTFTTVCPALGSPTVNYILVDNGSGCPTESGIFYFNNPGSGNVEIWVNNPNNGTTGAVYQNTADLWEFGLDAGGVGGFSLSHQGGCGGAGCVIAQLGTGSADTIGLGPMNTGASSTTTVDITNKVPTTGHTFVNIGIGAADTSSTENFAIAGIMAFNGSNSTASVAGLIGTTCPAITCTAAYTWIKAMANDGSIIYIPAWK
jgi:hypothetical protein